MIMSQRRVGRATNSLSFIGRLSHGVSDAPSQKGAFADEIMTLGSIRVFRFDGGSHAAMVRNELQPFGNAQTLAAHLVKPALRG
jgi:hypothetical protein